MAWVGFREYPHDFVQYYETQVGGFPGFYGATVICMCNPCYSCVLGYVNDGTGRTNGSLNLYSLLLH